MITFILIIIALMLLVFWCTQFLDLMRMKAEDFSSREDKVIWAACMLLLGALGAFLFWIHFKPEPEKIPQPSQLDLSVYEELKWIFTDHQREIELALQMSPRYRYDLEKWYGGKSDSSLINHYRNGPTADIEPGCFGVLLAVITARKIEL
jgi:hypothetical protein